MDDTRSSGNRRAGKSREAFRTISEVAELLDLPQHVLRFWESKFTQIKPLKRGGNRRYYRPDDVTLLTAIKKLLHSDGYTIRGVQKLFKAQGLRSTIGLALEEDNAAAIAAYDSRDPVAVVEDQKPDAANIASAGVQSVAEGARSAKAPELKPVLARLKAIRSRLD